MKKTKTLEVLKALQSIDAEIVEFKTRNQFKIDINDKDWMDQAKKQSELFNAHFAQSFSKARQLIGSLSDLMDPEEFKTLQHEISSCSELNQYILMEINDIKQHQGTSLEDVLLQSFFLLAVTNFEPDGRDKLLYFKELIDLANSKKIDYKSLLRKLKPYISDTPMAKALEDR